MSGHKALRGRMNLDLDYMDYPTGWAIQETHPSLNHDSECSANPEHPSGMGGPMWLCDCGAVEAKWRELRAKRAEGDQ